MIPAQIYNNQFSNVTCVVMSPSPRKVSRSINDLNTKLHNPPFQVNPQPQLPNRLKLIAFYKVTAVQTFYPPILTSTLQFVPPVKFPWKTNSNHPLFPQTFAPAVTKLQMVFLIPYAQSAWRASMKMDMLTQVGVLGI